MQILKKARILNSEIVDSMSIQLVLNLQNLRPESHIGLTHVQMETWRRPPRACPITDAVFLTFSRKRNFDAGGMYATHCQLGQVWQDLTKAYEAEPCTRDVVHEMDEIVTAALQVMKEISENWCVCRTQDESFPTTAFETSDEEDLRVQAELEGLAKRIMIAADKGFQVFELAML